jgi:hypothetical protein
MLCWTLCAIRKRAFSESTGNDVPLSTASAATQLCQFGHILTYVSSRALDWCSNDGPFWLEVKPRDEDAYPRVRTQVQGWLLSRPVSGAIADGSLLLSLISRSIVWTIRQSRTLQSVHRRQSDHHRIDEFTTRSRRQACCRIGWL